MAVEQGAHGFAELHVVLAVGEGDVGQAVAGEDQLAGGGVAGVDRQHAFLDDPRQVAPAAQGVVVHRFGQAGAEGGVDLAGEPLEQGRHAGEEVVHRGRRHFRAFGHHIDRQPGGAALGQQRAGGVEDGGDARLAAGAGFAGAGGLLHGGLRG
ncbi:hypothetical protein D3C76_1261360 [compost metagenome]